MRMVRFITSSLLLTAALGLSATASAYQFFVTIEGKSGPIKGESTQKGHEKSIVGNAFSYSVRAPRDLASGMASGKRQHGPVTFTKEWGAASPQLFQALVTNEVLKTVLFEFMQSAPTGEQQVYQTVTLTNASLSSLTRRASGANEPHELEDIGMTFQKIEIEDKIGHASASDDWDSSGKN